MSVDISQAVHALLASKQPIVDLVGLQIFSDHMPQGASGSALVLWTLFETPYMHLGGALGLDRATMQIDSYGVTRQAAAEIAWTVWTQLDNALGVVDGVHIKGINRASGIRSSTDRVLTGTDQYRFISSQDLAFSYCSLE